MDRIAVKRRAIAEASLETVATPALAPGEILLAVESFALTANNVTYAAMGDAMHYWDFFPAGEGDGIVPVWGHAHVVESRADGFVPGERVYGYWPMATQVVLQPAAVKAAAFTDASPHRAHLAAVYNQYLRLAGDAGHDPAREDVRAIFEPLFLTSLLIERMFARADWHGAMRLIVTSASSKTALALAHIARAKAPHIERIGLTSPANVEFVRGTGLYNMVVAYDAVDTLKPTAAVAVDFAGNGKVLRAIHEALGDALAYSCLVGLTHWEARSGSGAAMPGPKPVLFFAPDHAAATVAELGAGGFASVKSESWAAFAKDAPGLVTIAPVSGLAAAIDAYQALVAGTAKAEAATIVRL